VKKFDEPRLANPVDHFFRSWHWRNTIVGIILSGVAPMDQWDQSHQRKRRFAPGSVPGEAEYDSMPRPPSPRHRGRGLSLRELAAV
jgi:hypothetical protein